MFVSKSHGKDYTKALWGVPGMVGGKSENIRGGKRENETKRKEGERRRVWAPTVSIVSLPCLLSGEVSE